MLLISFKKKLTLSIHIHYQTQQRAKLVFFSPIFLVSINERTGVIKWGS